MVDKEATLRSLREALSRTESAAEDLRSAIAALEGGEDTPGPSPSALGLPTQLEGIVAEGRKRRVSGN